MRTNGRNAAFAVASIIVFGLFIVSCNGAAANSPAKELKQAPQMIPVPPIEPFNMTREQVIAKSLKPYSGPSEKGVDTGTMTGKVMCGYQGWFTCPGDGSGRGWFHWGKDVFEPGNCTVDLWPDMSEYDQDERCPTLFKNADGTQAFVYSSMNPKSVSRHFKWMRDYGIDGVFVQRFVTETLGEKQLFHANTALSNCREGANRYGRVYAVMYDLSGLQKDQIRLVIEDWKMLVDNMRLTKDANDHAYLHHNGKPVVSIWGIGFKGREYTLQECADLVDFLKNDKQYGGCTIMLGVPTYWRTLKNDCTDDKMFHDIIRSGDVISPWMVGRIRSIDESIEFAHRIWMPDIEWCKFHHKDYLPVVFPGFSWTNLKKKPNAFNSLPRDGGKFLWSQYVEAKKAGATMIYQAMFDEVDEGTAIFKCTNKPPVGASKFLTFQGLPSDYYLWLVGEGGKMIRGEIPVTKEIPKRENSK